MISDQQLLLGLSSIPRPPGSFLEDHRSRRNSEDGWTGLELAFFRCSWWLVGVGVGSLVSWRGEFRELH